MFLRLENDLKLHFICYTTTQTFENYNNLNPSMETFSSMKAVWWLINCSKNIWFLLSFSNDNVVIPFYSCRKCKLYLTFLCEKFYLLAYIKQLSVNNKHIVCNTFMHCLLKIGLNFDNSNWYKVCYVFFILWNQWKLY